MSNEMDHLLNTCQKCQWQNQSTVAKISIAVTSLTSIIHLLFYFQLTGIFNNKCAVKPVAMDTLESTDTRLHAALDITDLGPKRTFHWKKYF